MHELGIAQEIVAIVAEHAARQGHARRARDRQALGDPARRDPVLLRPVQRGDGRRRGPSSRSSRSPAGPGAAPAAARSCSNGRSAVARAAAPTWSGCPARNSESKNSRWLMCATCGCSDDSQPRLIDLQSGETIAIGTANDHDHDHDHEHAHSRTTPSRASPPRPRPRITATTTTGMQHSHSHGATVRLETEVLAKNNRLAERNRGWLAGRNILALNLVSSPGAGKTTLLERTIRDLGREIWRSRSSRATRRPSTTPSASGPPAAASSRSTPAPAATSTPSWSPGAWSSSTRRRTRSS